jgi:hypothetical protein
MFHFRHSSFFPVWQLQLSLMDLQAMTTLTLKNLSE